VIKNKFMLGAVLGSVALVPVAGMSALTASPAGAAKPKGITCTKITGKVDGTTFSAKINFKTCTGTTGASGKSTAAQTDPTTTINWANGKSTTFTNVENADGTKCKASATLLADETLSGAVTADTTKSTTVGAAVTGEFCVTENATTGKIKLTGAPGVPFKIAKA
jgi:hypothetical protein